MKYDAVILGGGPAAVSAALTLRARGKTAAILSGGIDDIPLSRASRITNYPGCPDISGRALLEAMEDQALDAGAEILHGRATSIAPLGDGFGVIYGADFCEAETFILCTGVAAGKAFPGERELLGRGVSYCVTCDGMLYRGKKVCVVGFTSDTKEEAELLRTMGCEVEMFTSRTAKYAVLGQERVTALSVNGEEHPCEAVFILRPAAAPDTLLAGLAMDGVHVAVDKATMKKRMESYIKQVLSYCKENYPGVVYAWDVVNEAVGDDGNYRTESMWYETYGDFSYITDAFTFARKYAEEGTKLFLNDYNEYMAQKRDLLYAKVVELHDAGILDGVGMQSHWDMDFPSVDLFETALEKYASIDGIEIQLTEIDMHNNDDSEEGLKKQAERYKEFFDVITKMKREGTANITSVTFWGLKDGESWLSGMKGETSYPLLFTDDMEKKPCYDSILEAGKTGGK